MIDVDVVRIALLGKPEAEETYPFDPVTLVAKVAGKMFALLTLDAAPARLTLKCDPDLAEELRAAHPAIRPGYHMDKRHWITITLDGTLDEPMVRTLIDESYRLVVSGLPRAARDRLLGERRS